VPAMRAAERIAAPRRGQLRSATFPDAPV